MLGEYRTLKPLGYGVVKLEVIFLPPDSAVISTMQDDGMICIDVYDPETGKELHTLRGGYNDEIGSLKFSKPP